MLPTQHRNWPLKAKDATLLNVAVDFSRSLSVFVTFSLGYDVTRHDS